MPSRGPGGRPRRRRGRRAGGDASSILARWLAGLAIVCAAPSLLPAQDVSGRVFEDRDGDGIRDAGEPLLAGITVRLRGTGQAGGIDATSVTDATGSYLFSPGDGCYLLAADDPPGWRPGPARHDGWPQSMPPSPFPVGRPRLSRLDAAAGHLDGGLLRITALGDSIARNFNFCTFPESFWYSRQVRSRLACVDPSAVITLDEAAVLGQHTDDLLVDDEDDLNNVFRVIEVQPQLITLSMIGNDLLAVDPGGSPTQTQVNRAVAEILDARQNLQEALAALVSAVPGADIVINTLYDNEAYNCATGNPTPFHRAWLPIINRMLRDLAWGQARRLSIAEAGAELAHEDQSGSCLGFTGMICRDFLHLDDIHPTQSGYTILREKLWEAVGGVLLGGSDPLDRVSLTGADHGYLRHVRRLHPRVWQVMNGATVTDPVAALDGQDAGAAARVTLGTGSEEFRVSGFPDWYDEIQIVRVMAGVRYRTTGSVTDDFYRFEASVTGQFRPPPGHAYTTTSWNFYTPLVGGGGPNQPIENADYPTARLLALPDVPAYRDVSATLTKNPVLPQGGPDYLWPPVTHEEVATTAVRVAAAPVAGSAGDGFAVELDAAWLDLYGWEKPRPPEVTGLSVTATPAGDLAVSFDAVPGAQRYNLYAGSLAALSGGAGAYDHGGVWHAPLCGATVSDAGAGRLEITWGSIPPPPDSYFLVTSHVSDVESPAGFASGGSEIDRSQSSCR